MVEPTLLEPGVPTWPEAVGEAYRAAGYWQSEPLDRFLHRLAGSQPNHPAVSGPDGWWSYASLNREADRLATGLRRIGLRAGEAVLLQMPNRGRFFPVLFALLRVGARPVMTLPAHRRAELSQFARITGATTYIGADRQDDFDFRALARTVRAEVPCLERIIIDGNAADHTALDDLLDEPGELPENDPGALALFQLSGGSTGVPKLIPRTHDDYLYSVRASAELCGLCRDTTYLAVLPLGHNFPLSSPGSLGTLWAGGQVVVSPHPAPDTVFPLIERAGVTIAAVVPPIARIWLEAAPRTQWDYSSLQVLQVGGGRLEPATARRISPELGCQLQQVFGMAEGLVNYTRLDDPEEEVVTSQGRPLSPADEIQIVDDADEPVPTGEVGHLLTRGPYTVRGYYAAPEHNARAFTGDGFYRTGDLVRSTPSGNLVVEGRAKEQVNRGGEKIATEEVEIHLRAHEAMEDAALVPVPDAFLGERTCAFLVPVGRSPSARELAFFLRKRGLADYKIPDRFEFVSELPRTATGKTDKRALRERLK